MKYIFIIFYYKHVTPGCYLVQYKDVAFNPNITMLSYYFSTINVAGGVKKCF